MLNKPQKKFNPVVKYVLIAVSAVALGVLADYEFHRIPAKNSKYVCANGKYYEELPNGDLILQKSQDNEPLLCQG